MGRERQDDAIVPPIVIGELWDLDWFPSVRAAEGHFEPWFAEEDYVAFDSMGQRLRLDSGGYEERRILRIFDVGGGGRFTVQPTGECDPEAMRRLLLEWLREELNIDDPALATSSLSALVERSVALKGWTYDPG